MVDRRVALVTGGSRGIGKAIAYALAKEGTDIMLLSSNAENLEVARQEIAETGAVVNFHAADLRALEGCEQAYAAMQQNFDRLDILINSAGATKVGAFLEQSDYEWEDGFALKLHAARRITKLAWPELVKEKGHVINIVGGFARTPDYNCLV